MTPIICYQYWNDTGAGTPIMDLKDPILISIATLRATGYGGEVAVLCHTPGLRWGVYPGSLDFRVIEGEASGACPPGMAPSYHRLLRKVPDLDRHLAAYDRVTYCDSDVFWLGEPLSPDVPGLSVHGGNTGVLSWSPSCPTSRRFLGAYEETAERGIRDPAQGEKMMRHYGRRYYQDETVITWMRRERPELFGDLPASMNHVPGADPGGAAPRNLHAIYSLFGDHRGWVPLIFAPWISALESRLSRGTLRALFGVFPDASPRLDLGDGAPLIGQFHLAKTELLNHALQA